MSKKNTFIDRDFQKLAIRVNQSLIENENLIGDQKTQVEKVMSLERDFVDSIKKLSRSNEVFGLFIDFVLKDLGNILSARPYFREGGAEFTKHITPAIKTKNPKRLMDFKSNFMLIKFIIDNWGDGLPKKSEKIYQELVLSRNILIENNIPLAINRAKIFHRKVPRSHLTLLDFINICTHGLISGIDKYNGPYTPVWRSVCIGRMVGYMIEEYSRPLIRMFPSDKKILYRANSLKHKMKIDDIVTLTEVINKSFEQDKEEGKNVPKLPITKEYLSTLMNSSNPTSTNVTMDDNDENEYNYESYDHIEIFEDKVGDEVEKMDLMHKVSKSSGDLETIERKIIRLKGVEL